MKQIQELLSERRAARAVIDREVRALERCLAEMSGHPAVRTNGVASMHVEAVPKRTRVVSAAERERARQRMKRYWREKKRAQRAATK